MFFFCLVTVDFGITYSKLCYNTESFTTDYLQSTELLILQAASEWLYVVPWGIRKVLNYIAKTYSNPTIYVTENGKQL